MKKLTNLLYFILISSITVSFLLSIYFAFKQLWDTIFLLFLYVFINIPILIKFDDCEFIFIFIFVLSIQFFHLWNVFALYTYNDNMKTLRVISRKIKKYKGHIFLQQDEWCSIFLHAFTNIITFILLYSLGLYGRMLPSYSEIYLEGIMVTSIIISLATIILSPIVLFVVYREDS